jgi:TetR/AcrR family transcriptional regulator, regulator of autoinduction and epiphytic fitness
LTEIDPTIDRPDGSSAARVAPVPMGAADPGPVVPLDGRTARAMRTRDSIVDATIALVQAGDVRPTAPRIAERAGVSVRSVFQHFDDLETLFAMVAERLAQRFMGSYVPVDPDLDLPERFEAFVDQRIRLHEVMTPMMRAAAVHAPFSHEITKRIHWGQQAMRIEVDVVFATELAPVPADERKQVLDMLDTIASWTTWNSLRAAKGRDVAGARAIVERLLRTVLNSIEG